MHLLSAEATAALSEATRLELARWCPRPNCSASTVSCLLDPDPEAASVHVRFCSNASWVRSYRDPSGWRLVEAPFVASRTPLSELAPGVEWTGAATLLGCTAASHRVGADDSTSFSGVVLMADGLVRVVSVGLSEGGPYPSISERTVLEFDSLSAFVAAAPGFAYVCLGHVRADVDLADLEPTASSKGLSRLAALPARPGMRVLLSGTVPPATPLDFGVIYMGDSSLPEMLELGEEATLEALDATHVESAPMRHSAIRNAEYVRRQQQRRNRQTSRGINLSVARGAPRLQAWLHCQTMASVHGESLFVASEVVSVSQECCVHCRADRRSELRWRLLLYR